VEDEEDEEEEEKKAVLRTDEKVAEGGAIRKSG
jgi:hypothetical protein